MKLPKKLPLFCLGFAAVLSLHATTFYLDADNGLDSRDGLSPQTAWKSLDMIDKAPVVPGDAIRLKRGGLWRGTFAMRSGEPGRPITIGNYGTGPLPLIQASLDASQANFWEEVRPGLWASHPTQYSAPKPYTLTDYKDFQWSHHQEQGAVAHSSNSSSEAEPGSVTAHLVVEKSGKSGNHIQWWGPYFTDFGDRLMLRLRARSKRPLKLYAIDLLLARPPWNKLAQGILDKELTPDWKEFTLILVRTGGENDHNLTSRLHLNLGSLLKPGDKLDIQLLSADTMTAVNKSFINRDIGNIIFDHGEKPCGRKRWSKDALEQDFDFFYSRPEARVFIKSPANPATLFNAIELALHTGCIISHANVHDAVVDGLAIRYGAAHGFGGGNSRNITIRNCDISFIGGAHQFTRDNGVSVRYGNGIEFWGNCDGNLVEHNRIWDIYDAAVTNQGGDDTEINITYRNNVIWNAEFSFEYWNRKLTDNIVFENNTCVNAGHGWAHSQRPDPNGAHLMFYANRAKTSRFYVRNNIFANTTEQGLRMDVVWMDTITLKHNLWFTGDKPVYRLRPSASNRRLIYTADMKAACAEFHQDEDSLFAQPVFIAPDKHDFRLAPDSPGYRQNFGAQYK